MPSSKTGSVSEILSKLKVENSNLKAEISNLKTACAIHNDSIEGWQVRYESVTRQNNELTTKLHEMEKDLQRVGIAYESVRTIVQLTSIQLHLDSINPTVTTNQTSLVKTNN